MKILLCLVSCYLCDSDTQYIRKLALSFFHGCLVAHFMTNTSHIFTISDTMRYKKRQQPVQQPRQPLYRHGVRIDDPEYVQSAAGVHGKDPQRKRPPMDPRYPPARVDRPDPYAYRGDALFYSLFVHVYAMHAACPTWDSVFHF